MIHRRILTNRSGDQRSAGLLIGQCHINPASYASNPLPVNTDTHTHIINDRKANNTDPCSLLCVGWRYTFTVQHKETSTNQLREDNNEKKNSCVKYHKEKNQDK